jgi:hypothetical protein
MVPFKEKCARYIAAYGHHPAVLFQYPDRSVFWRDVYYRDQERAPIGVGGAKGESMWEVWTLALACYKEGRLDLETGALR